MTGQAAQGWAGGASFNGAAVDQPRKCHVVGSLGPKMRGFNGAAVDQPRKCQDRTPARSDRTSFNGAAVDQPRKYKTVGGQRVFGFASMGPRLINRGNAMDEVNTKFSGLASMGPRLINRGNLSPFESGIHSPASFNGAAVDQPRKCVFGLRDRL